MQDTQNGLTGAAAADESSARSGVSRTDGRLISEGARAHAPTTLSREESSGGAAAPRLEKRTYFNAQKTAQNRIKLRNYGNGLAEVGWSFISAINPRKAARGQSSDRSSNEDRAARRAKSRLRQLILSANLTHLLTLTYRENVTDFKRAVDDLNRFIRKMRLTHPGWVYVAVAEQQERGAWHWHIAVRGRQDVELVRSLWREIVGEGNIDVSAPKGKRKDQRLYLVQYLGKYLVKEFANGGDRKLNKHRFRASRNVVVPLETFSIPAGSGRKASEVALQELYEAAGSIGFVWDGEGTFAGWACSWK